MCWRSRGLLLARIWSAAVLLLRNVVGARCAQHTAAQAVHAVCTVSCNCYSSFASGGDN